MAGGADSMISAVSELRKRTASVDQIRRLGQALWMMIGQPLQVSDVFWARALLGMDGDKVLWHALTESGALNVQTSELRPTELASLLCTLLEDDVGGKNGPRLIWTLPEQLSVPGVEKDGYLKSASLVVASAFKRLLLVSPYLEPRGVGAIYTELLAALQRGVEVVVLTHEAENLSSSASASLSELRKESTRIGANLQVYTAASDAGSTLLHLKVVVGDGRVATLGSANVTGKGLGGNLEAGVLLPESQALEIERVVEAAITQGLAKRVFSTEALGR